MYGADGTDYVWEIVRDDAEYEASREPLLASFMHATILSHSSLEQALSFHIANQLASPAMIATQIQALMLEIYEKDDSLKDALRKDLIAVVDRDPATKSFTDVILYFKGFQALQAYRISHYLWTHERQTLALFLNSRVNSVYHMDIHPGSRLGIGILLDHGTGIVIGETAVVGNNVSMLHGVTLGGAGMKNVARHPRVGNGEQNVLLEMKLFSILLAITSQLDFLHFVGVLIGAGATLLGNITVGDGVNIGARSMLVSDVPPHCVVVGVPARIVYRNALEGGYPSRFVRSSSMPPDPEIASIAINDTATESNRPGTSMVSANFEI